MIVTREWLKEKDACYSPAQIEALVPPEGLTLQAVMRLESVPAIDRVWVATREGAMSPASQAQFIAKCANRYPSTRWAARSPLACSVSGAAAWAMEAAAQAAAWATREAAKARGEAAWEAAGWEAWEEEHQTQVQDLLTILHEETNK